MGGLGSARRELGGGRWTAVARTVALCLACLSAVPAAGTACDLAVAGRARAVGAIDGDTIRLEDGREVRLAGVMAPKPGLSAGPDASPEAEAAQSALQSLVAGKMLALRLPGRSQDRYGRVLAHISVDGDADPLGVETALLRQGHALVAIARDRRACLGPLLAAEKSARADGLGLWRDPYYAVLKAAERAALVGREGTFVLAEGRVASVRSAGETVYLNFGRRWHDALSVTIWKGHAAKFEGGEDALRKLEGQRVRVRGWLAMGRGPLIRVSYPEQIERSGEVEP